MNFDRDPTTTDEYYVTAVQIFECCGVDSSGVLRVDALMDKFASDIKSNNAEFTYLKRLLDPDQSNPEINVTKLATSLHKYSESQKAKVDLDESFNLRSGQAPQDSDSGISSDGLQLLEELQCELKEKEHLAHQLRNQLDFTDRQHEETIASLVAERDALQRHLNLLRDENLSLSQLRTDYEEASERITAADTALLSANKELELFRKRNKAHVEQIAVLENDKLNLQDLLSKSKDECHRINEMYANRQSVLLEQNERLKTEHADLTSKVQDLEEFLQQILNEKLLLEMELKDSVNKYNQSHLRLDRSIDVSYTDDQMLSALDSLNADSRFASENRILDEESFLNALTEDPGRSTNVSLFDEIRLSICNKSRLNITDNNCDKCWANHSINTACTQTDEGFNEIKVCGNGNKVEVRLATVETQTSMINDNDRVQNDDMFCKRDSNVENTLVNVGIQTEEDICNIEPYSSIMTVKNNTIGVYNDDSFYRRDSKVENSLINVETQTEIEMPNIESYSYMCKEINNNKIANRVENSLMNVETQTEEETRDLEPIMTIQNNTIEVYNNGICYKKVNNVANSLISVETQTETEVSNIEPYPSTYKEVNIKTIATQTDQSKTDLNPKVYRNVLCQTEIKTVNIETQTIGSLLKPRIVRVVNRFRNRPKSRNTVETQTENELHCNDQDKIYFGPCYNCEKLKKHSTVLEKNISNYQSIINTMECNLDSLENANNQGKAKHTSLEALIEDLEGKLIALESACDAQSDVIDRMLPDVASATCQTDFDIASVATQVEIPCSQCEERNTAPHSSLKKLFWDPLKCLIQLFLMICFVCTVTVLYGASQRDSCARPMPWKWFNAQDIMDLLLRIEYTADVPM